MKRIKKILALLLTLVFLATLTTNVYASHSFPEKLDDWTEHDWEKFNEYVEKHWDKRKKWDWDEYDEWYRRYDYRDSWCYPPQPQPYPYYGGCIPSPSPAPVTPARNDYSGYNFYGGILDVYDDSTEAQSLILAKIMYLYGHSVQSVTAQACIGWAVMNSVDASGGNVDIAAVAGNFHYNPDTPTTDDYGRSLRSLAHDIIFRWKAGRAGISSNGRVLPGGYCWVWSTGPNVAFRNTPNESGTPWNFSYTSPYGS